MVHRRDRIAAAGDRDELAQVLQNLMHNAIKYGRDAGEVAGLDALGVRIVGDSAAAMLYADYVEAGQMPAVLANRFGGVIFHEACGHLLETTQVERGTTPFAERVGEPIAHSAVTAIDEGLTSGAFGIQDS